MRACGGCTACCTALAVQELDKPRHTACAHECAAGCSAYERRPNSCRDYRCLWLVGQLGDADRPDKLGVILTSTIDPDHPEHGSLPMVVEVLDGALRLPRVEKLVVELSQRRRVVLLTKDERRIVGGGPASSLPITITVDQRAFRPLAA